MLNKTFVLLEFQPDSNDNDITRTKQIQAGNKSMIVIVLAGGYAKRLQSITKDIPKPLLKVAGKPIISYIFDRLNRIEDIQRIIISTNLRFEEQFKEWLRNSNPSKTVEIISDRSRSDEEKPGALASLANITAGDSFGSQHIVGIKTPHISHLQLYPVLFNGFNDLLAFSGV